MIVQKFGGSSLNTPGLMKIVAGIVQQHQPRFVVLSAIGKTTNKLYSIAELLVKGHINKARLEIIDLHHFYSEYIKNLFPEKVIRKKAYKTVEEIFQSIENIYNTTITPHETKSIIAVGEIISTSIFKLYLDSIKVKSYLLDSLEIMVTDKNENPDFQKIAKNLRAATKGIPKIQVFVLQGFICRNANGDIDNFSRGASDYTATIIGSIGKADEIQIWTDTDGLRNNDPRIVKETNPVEELTYREASEMAFFGAKILHPKCIEPAEKGNIPVAIKNTFNPAYKGTVISHYAQTKGIKAVAVKDGIMALKIRSAGMFMTYGFLSKMFEIFEKHHTPVDMITTSEVSVSLTIDSDLFLDEILKELRVLGQVEVTNNQSIICIVGDFLAERTGLSAKVLDSISTIPIRMISYGGSINNMSVLINTSDKTEAMQLLQKNLFQTATKNVEYQTV